MERIKSGIRNLDRLTGGGIPSGHQVLVEGPAGAGKSNLGLEFLYRGVERGETGLYVSFQKTTNEVLRTTTFDWDFQDAVDSGEIDIAKFDPYRHEQVPDMLRSRVKESGAKRVVLDPVTDLDLYIDSRKDRRRNLVEINQAMSDLGTTTVMLAETEEDTELEREVADAIIELEIVKNEDELERQIYVKKLKGAEHPHGIHNYVFDSDGLKVQ